MATREPSTLRRVLRYVRAAARLRFDETADPRVQLEQAIVEARRSHQRLKEQAVTVIANQKQTERKLDGRLDALDEIQRNARQALLMADEARRAGDEEEARRYEDTAETLATQLVATEVEIQDLKELALQAARATERAKLAVEQSAHALQRKLADEQRLLNQLDQARMRESLNEAIGSLTETVGADVPTFAEVEDKIERRLARAQGRSELLEGDAEVRMLEVERASQNMTAKARLAELRTELGIGRAPAVGGAPTAGEAGESDEQERGRGPR